MIKDMVKAMPSRDLAEEAPDPKHGGRKSAVQPSMKNIFKQIPHVGSDEALENEHQTEVKNSHFKLYI